jgi:hypothetical protein
MASISLTFTGSTMDEVARLIAGWRPAAGGGAVAAGPAPMSSADDSAAVRRVVSLVNGQLSRRLLRLLAEAGLRGETVELSNSLMQGFKATSGSAFGGMIGPVNRVAIEIMGRKLIDNPDPRLAVWRVRADDAAAVLEALDAK